MLTELSAYIVSEAIKKEYVIQAYKKVLLVTEKVPTVAVDEVNVEANLESTKADITQTLLDRKITQGIRQEYTAQNQAIQKAINALFEEKARNWRLEELAEVANMSPSYFSRLFTKEMGENLSKFYQRVKVAWGKELLVTTDMSVSEISDALGFVEPSYFVRVFKQVEGVTPLRYKKLAEQN